MLDQALNRIIEGLIIGSAWLIFKFIGFCDWIRERG